MMEMVKAKFIVVGLVVLFVVQGECHIQAQAVPSTNATVAPDATKEAKPGDPTSGFVILSTTYGTDDIHKDITDLMKAKIRDGRLDFDLNHVDLGVGDPAPGYAKKIHIKYSFHGVEYDKDYKTFGAGAPGDYISLPTSLVDDALAKEKADPTVIQRLMEESSSLPEGCTLEKFRVVSPCMGRSIPAEVVLPPEYKDHPEKSYPILYFCHGSWGLPYTICEDPVMLTFLKDHPMIVASFYPGNGWYQDVTVPKPVSWLKGETFKETWVYTTFFFDEFVPCVDQNYRVNPKQRMITGCSMGSSGSFHYAMTKPEMFVSASSIVGGFLPSDGVTTLIQARVREGKKLPALCMWIGAKDGFYAYAQNVRKCLEENKVPFTYVEEPEGKHDLEGELKGMSVDLDFHWRSLQQQKPSANPEK